MRRDLYYKECSHGEPSAAHCETCVNGVHAPKKWVLIDPTNLKFPLLHAMCVCGDDNCAWTLSVNADRAVNVNNDREV